MNPTANMYPNATTGSASGIIDPFPAAIVEPRDGAQIADGSLWYGAAKRKPQFVIDDDIDWIGG